MEDYLYPASEKITDALELAMDPYKLVREELVLRMMLQFDWDTAVDIGCGVGRYLQIFADVASSTPNKCRFLLAVEPDSARRDIAEANAEKLNKQYPFLTIIVVPTLETSSLPTRYDLVTCSQVLGHVTHKTNAALLVRFKELLNKDGAIVVLIPVIMNDGIKQFVPWESSPDDDYYFEVNLSRTPFDPDYSRPLNRDSFDKAVDAGAPGILPVRAFNIDSVIGHSLVECPALITKTPAEFKYALPNMHALGLVYSFHRFADNSINGATLGDAVIRFTY